VESDPAVALSLSWLRLGSYRSSSWRFFFLPQMRQPVYASPARRRAPPTPPTTPPIVFFAVSLSPELPPLLPPLVKEAGSTLVVNGTSLLLVLVIWTVLPALTLVMVVMTSWIEWDVIKVFEAVRVLVVTVDTDSPVETVLPAEFVGVKVEVVRTTVVDGEEELALSVMVEDSVMTEVEVVEVETMTVVEPVTSAEEDADEVSLLPPVDSGTLWRLNRAMASSRASAETAGAKSMPKRRRPSFFMVKAN